MRSDLFWALNKSYTVHLVFKIRRTRLSGHVQALKYTKTRDLSLFRLLIRPTQPNGHVLALKSTKDARSDPIWDVFKNIPGHFKYPGSLLFFAVEIYGCQQWLFTDF